MTSVRTPDESSPLSVWWMAEASLIAISTFVSSEPSAWTAVVSVRLMASPPTTALPVMLELLVPRPVQVTFAQVPPPHEPPAEPHEAPSASLGWAQVPAAQTSVVQVLPSSAHAAPLATLACTHFASTQLSVVHALSSLQAASLLHSKPAAKVTCASFPTVTLLAASAPVRLRRSPAANAERETTSALTSASVPSETPPVASVAPATMSRRLLAGCAPVVIRWT